MNKFLLVTLTIVATGASAALPDGAAWEFNVFLDEKKIGSHDFVVSNENGGQVVDSKASFDVKLLFINVFSYRHQNREVWDGNCLSSISAETDANGKDFRVKGRADGQRFRLESGTGQDMLQPCVKTFAYWNPSFLQASRLLNSQTGEFEDVEIASLGTDTIVVKGKEFAAIKYQVSADSGEITLWYAADDKRWLALESVVNGGRTLRYEPVSVPAMHANSIDLAELVLD